MNSVSTDLLAFLIEFFKFLQLAQYVNIMMPFTNNQKKSSYYDRNVLNQYTKNVNVWYVKVELLDFFELPLA